VVAHRWFRCLATVAPILLRCRQESQGALSTPSPLFFVTCEHTRANLFRTVTCDLVDRRTPITVRVGADYQKVPPEYYVTLR
jgi:hypothetical protein